MHTLKTIDTFPTFKYFSVKDNRLQSEHKWDKSYLYIGLNEKDIDALKTDFVKGFSQDNLESGIQFLHQCSGEQEISVIFIDLPFCYTSFHVFLSEKEKIKELLHVPVILNIRNLTPEEVSFIRKKKLADELVDFKIEMGLVHEKIEFLSIIRQSISDSKFVVKIENKPSSVYPDTFFVKRSMDILLSVILIILFSPLFILIALAIKLESPGPVFYNSYRAGRGFSIFKLYHFRTMKVGADRMLNSFLKLNKFNNFGHAPVYFLPENDPRITRVGHFLSKSGLDKLPSLINLLKGNLSLVGTDPMRLYEAASLTNNDSANRFVMTTGLSGMWKLPRFKSILFGKTENLKTSSEGSNGNRFSEVMSKLSTPLGSIQTIESSSVKGR